MITISDLTFAYPSEQSIFNDFSFQIDKGSLFGLLGPNGAGKTTLISLITGLNVPQAGRVLIDGENHASDRRNILQKIAVVPQEYAFYSQLSAYENLWFFSRMYPDIKNSSNRIQKAIQLTGLEPHQHRLAKHLSGGLKRRLNLSIGLLNDPELLILDEPTVGIDPQSRRFILQAIQRLNQQGTTVLYTSHYMGEVEQICNQVAIIDNGKLLASGPLEKLLQSGSEGYVEIEVKLPHQNINGKLDEFISNNALKISNHTISGNLASAKLLATLVLLLDGQQIQIESMRYGQHTLESLFFDLTHTQLREG